MRYRLQTKLSINNALIVLVTVGLISLLSRYFIVKQFISYVNSINQERINNIVYSLEHQYHEGDGWDTGKIFAISKEALEDGIILTVTDRDGREIWDTSKQMHQTDEELLSKIKENMKSRYIGWNGKIIEKQFPVYYRKVIGTAAVKYYSPYYFTDKDFIFLNMLSKILGSVMAISLILAILLGIWMSRQISVPISSAVILTKEISKGNISNRIDEKSNTVEILELARATNLLAERLEEQETIRKRIVSDVSHELRTPLTAIENYIEALIDGVWEPSRDRLVKIHREILRINRLVGDLSKLSRYENNIDKLKLQLFNLDEMIARIVTQFELQGKKRNITIRINNNVEEVYADEDKLSQVIVNILSNSFKYSFDNSSICISTYKDSSNVVIVIKDEGIGISEEKLPYIFERFYRADDSRSRETGGAGIGLTIVKAIIEAHGGEIEVKSKIEKGTKFIIRLPQKALDEV